MKENINELFRYDPFGRSAASKYTLDKCALGSKNINSQTFMERVERYGTEVRDDDYEISFWDTDELSADLNLIYAYVIDKIDDPSVNINEIVEMPKELSPYMPEGGWTKEAVTYWMFRTLDVEGCGPIVRDVGAALDYIDIHYPERTADTIAIRTAYFTEQELDMFHHLRDIDLRSGLREDKLADALYEKKLLQSAVKLDKIAQRNPYEGRTDAKATKKERAAAVKALVKKQKAEQKTMLAEAKKQFKSLMKDISADLKDKRLSKQEKDQVRAFRKFITAESKTRLSQMKAIHKAEQKYTEILDKHRYGELGAQKFGETVQAMNASIMKMAERGEGLAGGMIEALGLSTLQDHAFATKGMQYFESLAVTATNKNAVAAREAEKQSFLADLKGQARSEAKALADTERLARSRRRVEKEKLSGQKSVEKQKTTEARGVNKERAKAKDEPSLETK